MPCPFGLIFWKSPNPNRKSWCCILLNPFFSDQNLYFRYDVLPITCLESLVFISQDRDNENHKWAAVDSDFCPWTEVYTHDDFTDAISVPALAPPTKKNNIKRKHCDDEGIEYENHPDASSESEYETSVDEDSDSDDDDVRDDLPLMELLARLRD